MDTCNGFTVMPKHGRVIFMLIVFQSRHECSPTMMRFLVTDIFYSLSKLLASQRENAIAALPTKHSAEMTLAVI